MQSQAANIWVIEKFCRTEYMSPNLAYQIFSETITDPMKMLNFQPVLFVEFKEILNKLKLINWNWLLLNDLMNQNFAIFD